MKLSDNYEVQQLVKERSDLSSKLYSVSTESAGFSIAFHGTFIGGEPLEKAAAALVPYYKFEIQRVENRLKALGVRIDDD